MNVIRYEQPIIKKACEMETGDIFRTEYGDFDNWVEVVFVHCFSDGVHTQIQCTWIGSSKVFSMTDLKSFNDATFEVIGKVSD